MNAADQTRAFDFVAHWHDEQWRRFRSMSEDYPRIDEETCAKAGDASRHHFGSAAALRIRASDIRRSLRPAPPQPAGDET